MLRLMDHHRDSGNMRRCIPARWIACKDVFGVQPFVCNIGDAGDLCQQWKKQFAGKLQKVRLCLLIARK
jgi:hypothetical protein